MKKEVEYEGKKLEVVEISLPFTEDQLDEYFNNIENYYFIIDFNNSDLSANQMINYIYNSNMNFS